MVNTPGGGAAGGTHGPIEYSLAQSSCFRAVLANRGIKFLEKSRHSRCDRRAHLKQCLGDILGTSDVGDGYAAKQVTVIGKPFVYMRERQKRERYVLRPEFKAFE